MEDAGGICISRGTHDQIAGKLSLIFEHLGEHPVKTQTVRAYKVVVPDGAEMPEPAPQSAAKRSARSWRIAAVAAGVVRPSQPAPE